MKYRLQDLIDLEQFQSLLDQLSGIYPFPSAIIDNDGVILVATAWQDLCTQYHRQNAECEKACIKSDQYILDHLAEAAPAVSYRCPHGLIDNAMPIIIDGHHLASFFTGQFFLEAPDLEFFREQARNYGFDEEAYLEAVKKVPIWNREQLDSYLAFIKEMIDVLSSVGLKNLKAREADAALRESEYFFRESQRAAFIGSYKTNFVTGAWESSEVLDRIFGIDQDFARTIENWVELVHPNDREMMNRYLLEEVVGHARPFTKEYRIIRKSDGAVRWVNGLGEVGLDAESRVVSLIGTIQDITERKQAESERVRLMEAIEQVAETIAITDAGGAIQYVNPFFEKVTGYTRKEAIGQNPRILSSGEHDDAYYKDMWDTLTRGEVWNGQIVNKKKDGTHYTEDATISPVRDATGKTVNYVGVLRDITYEIELNTQLRQAQKMEAVGQLAGGIAHDFNNLLQVILGYGYLALREVTADSPANTFIEEMMRAGERASTLVGQLLAFSRRQVLEMKDVNLNDPIADVLKMLRRVIGEHITLDVISSADLGIVRADPGQIDQILMNLCVNARDAMGKSGKITIKTENVRIDDEFCEVQTWAKPGRYVLLSVTDTGCGMDEKTLEKVFEPFFTTKDVGNCTGLGLATVYGVVRQHDGLIHVYSEPGHGTTFRIYLPLAERSSAVVGKKIEGSVPVGNETILLAEDNETFLKLTRMFLENAGYSVLTATDGQDALRIFEEHADEIDMALLDVMMPNLGGKAVFERIRETRPDFPFLFASGYSMGSLHDNFVLDEGLHLIQKPFRRDDLLRKVREVLDNGSTAPNEN